ncbi:hypothetical protein [uncultured Cardiobacterium sp.]|uniref:YncE family protein n=1 Tax=uncultured Cardiobacterium sp. TaxID=417619 RepID=UPI002602CFAC|nr:hypothetical protein [uncultured Cardiobacterium sp.]
MKRRHLVLGGAALLARPLWAQDAPETPAATPVSLYDPTRYVFAADEGVAQVLVVDLEEGRQIDKIRMPVAIRVLSSSTDKPYLAVSDRRRYAIVLYDLENRDMREIPIPSRAMRMIFVPESSKLAVVFEDRVGMVDYRSGEVSVPEKTFQNLYTRFSTIFSVYSQTFWVLQENTPLIYQYSFLNPEAGWQTIDIGETRGLGRGAPSFEDRLIAFNTYYADEGIIYFADSGKIIKTGPMYKSRKLNEPLLEPFIDNGMRHVIFGDTSGRLLIYEPDKSDEPQRLDLGYRPRVFRTGWLDRYLVVGGDRHLSIHPFADLSQRTQLDFGYDEDVLDMWISGDSKTVIYGRQYKPLLGRYDLQHMQPLPDIPLSGISQPIFIRMGSTNNVCY